MVSMSELQKVHIFKCIYIYIYIYASIIPYWDRARGKVMFVYHNGGLVGEKQIA